jgi:hypothetical protein
MIKILVFVLCSHCVTCLSFKRIRSSRIVAADLKLGSVKVKAMLTGLIGGLAVLGRVTLADDIATKTYTNDFYHTTFQYPSTFTPSVGDAGGDRQVEAFVDPTDHDTSVSIVYTPIPGDYTRINSFGGPVGLKQYMLPEGAQLLSEDLRGETYALEYSGTDPSSGVTRHVWTVFSLQPATRVVGLTVQTKEESLATKGGMLSAVPKSLKTN